jgi:hypothetical protein
MTALVTFDTPLRTYVVLHTYFKSLLNGVQGGHACVEMSVKYIPGTPESNMYQQWARVDKTLLYLDGGVSLHMHAFLSQLQSLDTNAHLPWSHFVEDQATLEGMLTAVAVILPESIAKATPLDWEAAKREYMGPIHDDLRKLGMTFNNSPTFFAVIDWLRSRSLAS